MLPSIFNGLIDCTAAYCNVKFEAKSIQLHNWYMTAILAKKLKWYHKETQETITEKVFFCFAFSLLKRDIKFPPIWLLDFFYLFNCLLDRMKCEKFTWNNCNKYSSYKIVILSYIWRNNCFGWILYRKYSPKFEQCTKYSCEAFNFWY